MLDDGERLVPGFRQARALRVWAGVRPLFQDARAGEVKDTRDVSRTHAVVDHLAARRHQGPADDVRRQAHDAAADGRRTSSTRCASSAATTARAARRRSRPPGNEDGEAYEIGSRLRRREETLQDEQLICECELIGRARLEAAMRRRGTTNLDDIRRAMRLGMGPCQGGFCIYRATGILHARRPARRRGGRDVAARASCRSAGRACCRSSTATSCARRGSTTGSSRACSTSSTCRPGGSRREPPRRDRRRLRARGAHRRRAARRGGRARARARQGRRRDASRAGDDRRARPARRRARGAAARGARRARRRRIRTRASAPTASRAAADWFTARVAGGSLAPYAYTGSVEREPAAADRGRRRRGPRRSCRRRWPPATSPRTTRSSRSASAASRTSTPRSSPTCSHARACARGASSSS